MAKPSTITKNTVRLPVRPPFDFNQCLAFLTRSDNECLFRVAGNAVQRLLRLGPNLLLIEVSAGADGLNVAFLNDSPAPTVQAKALAYIGDWFDTARDMGPFYRLAERDPLLGPLTKRYFGLRLVGIPDLFEAVGWAIIGQQINLAFAYTLKRRLVEAYGERLNWQGRDYWLFPEPARIAGLTEAALTRLQFTGAKARYLIGIAQAISEGRLTRPGLDGDLAAARAMLTGYRGIGPWTADYVALKCLRQPAAFPSADAGLQNGLKALLGLDRKPNGAELEALARSWAGWEGYVTFYVWRSLYG